MKFEKGDRVVVVKKRHNSFEDYFIGDFGTVHFYDDPETLRVTFDENTKSRFAKRDKYFVWEDELAPLTKLHEVLK